MSASFLEDTQRRLWRLIAWPEGVRAGLAEEDAGVAPLASVVKSDVRLEAEHRLDVYANAYFYRIHDVLAEDFPTLLAILGEDAFHDLVTSYLAVHPSRHPSLRFIGDRLATFLEAHDAAKSFRERFPQAADLARFEAASEDVFDAADTRAATREDLQQLAPDAWESLPVRLRPSVRVLQLGWPVHRARHALRNDEPMPALVPEPVALCLWRREEQVVHRELEASETRVLRYAARGISFGALCEEAAREIGEEAAPARAATWLAGWVDAAWIESTRPGD